MQGKQTYNKQPYRAPSHCHTEHSLVGRSAFFLVDLDME